MIFILAIVSIISFIFLRYTVPGKSIYFIGANERVSELSGMKVNRWKIFIFVFSGTLAAIAGLMAGSRIGQVDPQQIGQGYEMTAIAIAILGGASLSGGRGTILGTIQAAIILGIVTNIQNLYSISSYYQSVTTGIILILVVVINEQVRTRRGNSFI